MGVGAVKLAHKMGLLWEKWGRIASLRGTTSPGRKLNGAGPEEPLTLLFAPLPCPRTRGSSSKGLPALGA